MNFSVVTPKNKAQLLSAIKTTRNFRFGAGYTDLIPEIRKHRPADLTVINLAQLRDSRFTEVDFKKQAVRIGSLVTADTLEYSVKIAKDFPVLREAARNLASPQIRHIATVGGNICTASPSGDIACALVALRAQCDILAATGKSRTVALSNFFKGPRKTALSKKEVLRSISIPANKTGSKIHSGFIKVGTRRSMECSVVSLAWHFQTDRKGKIISAGVAFGAAAPTVIFANEACEFITGKNINTVSLAEKEQFAELILQRSNPISDLRATAWYRAQVLRNIAKTVFG